MPLPTTGPISLLDVANEFGGTNPIGLNEYYGVASGIPASGTIDLNVFHGKSIPVTGAYIGGAYNKAISGWTPQAGDLVVFACTTYAYNYPVGTFNAPAGYTMINYTASARAWSGNYWMGARLGYRICNGSENGATYPQGSYGTFPYADNFLTVYRFSKPVQSVSLPVNSSSTSSGGSVSFGARSGVSVIAVSGAGYNIPSPYARTVPTQDLGGGNNVNQFASKLVGSDTPSSVSWSTSVFPPATVYSVFSPNF